VLMEPIFITRVEDKDGNVLEQNRPNGKEVLNKETAYTMVTMLQSVLDYRSADGHFGTGVAARSRYGFTRPAAGKSGTTNDYRDTWFLGFTPQFATGVWVGFDQQDMSFHRGTGSSIALPIWAPFMKAIHDTLQLPVAEFSRPETMIRLQICTVSNQLANEQCPSVRFESFVSGSQPTSHCEIHTVSKKYQRRRSGRRSD